VLNIFVQVVGKLPKAAKRSWRSCASLGLTGEVGRVWDSLDYSVVHQTIQCRVWMNSPVSGISLLNSPNSEQYPIWCTRQCLQWLPPRAPTASWHGRCHVAHRTVRCFIRKGRQPIMIVCRPLQQIVRWHAWLSGVSVDREVFQLPYGGGNGS
jgi:hypothetical protein